MENNLPPSNELPVSVSKGPALHRHEETAPAPNLLAMLHALRRRWFMALSLGLLTAAAVAAAAWFGLPIRYTVSCLLHLSAAEPRVLATTEGGGVDFNIYQKTQATLVRNRRVLISALKKDSLSNLTILPPDRDQQIDWLQNSLRVDFKAGPEIMSLSLDGDRPQELKRILDVVADTYLKEVVSKDRSRKLTHLARLKEIQSNYEESLNSRRDAVNKLVLAVGSSDAAVIATKQRYALEVLNATEKQLIEVKWQRTRQGTELATKKARMESGEVGSPPSSAEIEAAINKHPSVIQLAQAKQQAERLITNAEGRLKKGKDDPLMRPYYDSRDNLKAELDALRKRLRSEVAEELGREATRQMTSSVSQLEEQDRILRDLENTLSKQVDFLQKQSQATTVNQAGIESFKAELAQADKMANQVAAQVETLKIESDAPERVSLLEEASIQWGAMRQKRLKLTGGAAGLSFLLVVGLVGWREYRFRRLSSITEVVHDLAMPVVGILPRTPQRGHSSVLSGPGDWQHLFRECVDATRTSLLHVARQGQMRILMVTSALKGEGKTSLAGHLAVSLARVGYKVILLDADMRRPAVHALFGAPMTPGLSEVLREEAHLAEVVHPTEVDGLWQLPAGRWSIEASQGLAQRRLPELLQTLKTEYDYVIVDSPPILPVVDSLLLGQHVDGVLLSLLREVSQLPLVREGYLRLSSVGARMLGGVLSGVPFSRWDYTYGPSPTRGNTQASSTLPT
jgi:capsular exopolysaccharide synthesis family protein